MKQTNQIPGLYDPSFEHDNCGIGACVNIKGVKNHQTVDNALKIVETLEHRAGKDAAGETGDGVGIMLQISHKFFNKACKEAGINIGKEREYGIGMFFFPRGWKKQKSATGSDCSVRRGQLRVLCRAISPECLIFRQFKPFFNSDS